MKQQVTRRFGPYFDVAFDAEGKPYVDVHFTGDALLRFPLTNKGTAFTAAERTELGLDGLLPPVVETLAQQVARAEAAYMRETSPLAKYQFLRKLQDRNEVMYYALLERHLKLMLPIVYTPTVGEAVERFSLLYHASRGVSLARRDAKDPKAGVGAAAALAAYPCDDARMIVVTDSSAILGIGDQGYNGLAIPIGKLALYTVAGGVSPFRSVPVVLDVGTDRAERRDDPLYLGMRHPRLQGDEYLAFVTEFVDAVRARWPKAIIQWEDLAKETAFTVLDAFRDTIASFNDDIQGTGAVALAGLVTAMRREKSALKENRFLVYGAGAGGVGVARAIRDGLEREGLTRAEALARIFVVDSKGLLVESRAMEAYKREFAQSERVTREWQTAGPVPTFLETVKLAKITALLGLSGQAGKFDETVVRAVSANATRPIVFPLSNPTSACEAAPLDILEWSEGRAIVATGSPFDPVTAFGKTHVIGQGNNAFIFPGLGFGAILAGASRITDGMVTDAAYALADFTFERYVDDGLIYPPVEDLRAASVRVAERVVRRAIADGVATRPEIPEDVAAWVEAASWTAAYLPFKKSLGKTFG